MRKSPRARPSEISELTTRRLSVYLRCLNVLESAGVETVSSQEIAQQFHLNSAQFRKDLAYFGEFGVRGMGYRVAELKDHLVHILGLNREVSMAIVGAGNLGMALADYDGFNTGGFKVVALFDSAAEKIGSRSRAGLIVQDVRRLAEVAGRSPMHIAILAVPAEAGQAVLDRVAAAGILAVLNFVPARLKVPDGIRLKTVDLKVQVESLVFHLAQSQEPEGVTSPSSSSVR